MLSRMVHRGTHVRVVRWAMAERKEETAIMKYAAIPLMILPGTVLAHGANVGIAEPFHTLSHTGQIVGMAIIVVALIAFYKTRGQS